MSDFRDVVAAFAAEFEAAMDDTVTFRDPTAGQGTYNPATRTYTGAAGTVRYTGKALVRPRGRGDTQFGERQIETADYDVYLPAGTDGISPDQQMTVDATGTTSPELEGRIMTVRAVAPDSFNARLLVECELNEGGGDAV